MNSLALIGLAAIASMATASDERTGTPAGAPPVLRTYEPAESVVFRLPGPPPQAPPAARKVLPIPPAAIASPLPAKLVPASIPPPPVPATSVVTPVKPELPAEVTQEVAFYCQKHVGQWKEGDARKLLGSPLRSR